MPLLLIVEDDAAMRGLLREHLGEVYKIVETGDSTEALALALQHKPDCILLDLMLPEFSGFELCQILSSLSVTQLTPVIVITAKPAAEYKEFCLNLGARAYFEKPVNITQLKALLSALLETERPEHRKKARVRLSAILGLRWVDPNGKESALLTTTENISSGGFLCTCTVPLDKGAVVDVSLVGSIERYVGCARVVRAEWRDTPAQRYGFQFLEKPRNWILQ